MSATDKTGAGAAASGAAPNPAAANPAAPAINIKQVVGSFLVDHEVANGKLHSGTPGKPFRVGLGTGTTAIWAIRRLAEKVRAGELAHLVCVPTSLGSQLEAQKLGLPVTDLNDPVVDGAVDWSFDGADQVNPHFQLIKGGGAAHAREKTVAANAARFVVLVDSRKMVHRLGGDPAAAPGTNAGTCQCDDGPNWDGNAYAVPVEVMPGAMVPVSRALESFGARVQPRESGGKIGPVVSDNGFYILDAVFPEGLVPLTDTDPVALEMAIKTLPGVLDVGIFTCPVQAVFVGQPDGSVQVLTEAVDAFTPER